MGIWYVQQHGDPRPMTADDVFDLFRRGEISSETWIWREGLPNWLPLAQSELASGLAVATPGGRIEPTWGSPSGVDPTPALAVQDDGWQDATPHPWRRYFARMIDVTLLSAMMGFVLGVVLVAVSPRLHEAIFVKGIAANRLLDTLASLVLVIPANALLVGLFGTTPGKWSMGVRVTRRDGRPIGSGAALAREFEVWWRGFGCGIPLVSLATLIAGYTTLTRDGAATWDQGRPWLATYRPGGTAQVLFAIGGIALWIGVFAAISAMD